MKGWIIDTLRTAWSFFYWNTRKSWYRWRGARWRCPCQNPSDSGVAHVTGCEAVIGWARPERFRRVCPLLERGTDGRWCCSVGAAQVRPFWGRAAAAAGFVVLVVYLGGTLAAWGVLRARGYPLSVAQVAWWPTLRRELPRAQSELFLRQARAFYEAGRIQEAILSLRSAWQDDPANYAAGMLLAQFTEGVDPVGASKIYERLRVTQPEKRGETTRRWFYMLLTHGDYVAVAGLAREELAVAPTEAAWWHALIFSARLMRDAAPLEALATVPGGITITPTWREIVTTEVAVLRGTLAGEELRQRLRTLLPSASAHAPEYAWAYPIERQLMGGWAADAMAGVRAGGNQLSGRERGELLLATYAVAGDEATRVSEIKKFLAARPQLNDAELELLCAHLIRYPQAEALTALAAAWSRDSRPPEVARLPWALAFYCAAAVGRDEAARQAATNWIKQATGGRLPASLESVAEILRTPRQEKQVNRLLPTLPPLPLEVVYALLSRQIQPKMIK